MIWRSQVLFFSLLLLALIGGTGLVYKVATASSYRQAFDDVFSSARGKVAGRQSNFSAVPSKAKQSINVNAFNSTPAPFV